MIYMVEMDLTERDRRTEWDAWYLAHTRMLLSFPGFHATQRFECLHEAHAPFVALHHVDGPEFFDSAPYRNQAGPTGTGEWRTKMTNWSRNLFDGIEAPPAVPVEGGLLVVEDGAEDAFSGDLAIAWGASVALDRDVPRRGFAVTATLDQARAFVGVDGIRVCKPMFAQLTKADL